MSEITDKMIQDQVEDVDAVPQELIAAKLRALKGQLPSEIAAKFQDPELKRFLIARKYSIEKTIEMIVGYVQWRVDKNVDEIPMPDGSQVPYLMHLRQMYSLPDVNYDLDQPNVKQEFQDFYPAMGGCGMHGYDKKGRPIYIARLGQFNVRKLAETSPPEAFEDFHIRNHEFIFTRLMEAASKRKGELVEQVVNIFDCAGMGLSSFHIPGIMLLKIIADMNQKVYPERLGKLYIVNAPVFFNAAWAIIKVWLDKRILEKITVCGSDYKKTLTQEIDHHQLPSFLGGTCTCAHMAGGCCPSPIEIEKIKPNPQAHRYVASLKKAENTHVHTLEATSPGTMNFKFDSPSALQLLVKNDQEEV